MSELHQLLWTLCRKLPSDFTPFGQRDRDSAEPWQDCSCGCLHFLPLAGDLGNDWGVCANPQSPRAGLLTFEHQGCPQFAAELPQTSRAESAPTPDAQIPAATKPPEPQETPPVPRGKLKIDFDEFQMAIEGFDTLGEPMSHFLDTETGEVLVLCRHWEDYDELCERIDGDLGERYRRIEPLESHESFRIMEDFAASLPDSAIKSRLFDALSRNKPFRHFKDIVHSDPALRDRWFQFRDEAHEQYLREWLRENEVEAEILRRRTTRP
jgi:hypothetical protein